MLQPSQTESVVNNATQNDILRFANLKKYNLFHYKVQNNLLMINTSINAFYDIL